MGACLCDKSGEGKVRDLVAISLLLGDLEVIYSERRHLFYESDGSMYFTDPPYGFRTQRDDDPDKQLSVNGVYRIPRALNKKQASSPLAPTFNYW